MVLQMQYFYHTFPLFYIFDLFSVLLQLFVYTCAKREYAEKILNILDPQRKVFRSVLITVSSQKWTKLNPKKANALLLHAVFLLRHRLYQEDCICVLGHYIKDLSILGRDLTKTVVLDNMPHTYPYHVRTAKLGFIDYSRIWCYRAFCRFGALSHLETLLLSKFMNDISSRWQSNGAFNHFDSSYL